MNFDILCSNNYKKMIVEILRTHDNNFDENSKYILIDEKYCNKLEDYKEKDIKIIFNENDLNSLLDFFKQKSLKNDKNGDFVLNVNSKLSQSIVGKIEERYEILKYEDIIYFEADNNYVYCITKKGNYRVKDKLYTLEEKLDKEKFIRISKSYIVNILMVNGIVPWFNGRLLLKFEGTNKEIDVSRTYAKKFKNFLGL